MTTTYHAGDRNYQTCPRCFTKEQTYIFDEDPPPPSREPLHEGAVIWACDHCHIRFYGFRPGVWGKAITGIYPKSDEQSDPTEVARRRESFTVIKGGKP